MNVTVYQGSTSVINQYIAYFNVNGTTQFFGVVGTKLGRQAIKENLFSVNLCQDSLFFKAPLSP